MPKVEKNKARNPVRIFCPNEKSSSIAQTTLGTFLKNAAMIRTIPAIQGFTFVVFVPSRLRKKAQTEAQTVTATDRSAVSIILSRILGSFSHELAFGIKFFAIQPTAWGIDSKPLIASNFVAKDETAYKAIMHKINNKNVRFLLIKTEVWFCGLFAVFRREFVSGYLPGIGDQLAFV